ncbi:hypothetical protein [Amycolatopsis sp. cmx-4-68]|uniref:hypothetical protein n=1 Tax=Amycolatopsis sp. cmx-4-68 TaxID=2790938 RepID=UPI003979F431
MTQKTWAGSGIFALLFPVVLGCGGGSGAGTSSSSENPSDSMTSGAVTTPGGAPGGPVGTRPGGAAQGAPIKVPAFAAAGGKLESVKAEVDRELKAACGDGTLCVDLHYVVVPDGNDSSCVVTEVQPSTTVNRHSRLTVTITCQDKVIPEDSPPSSTATTPTTSS